MDLSDDNTGADSHPQGQQLLTEFRSRYHQYVRNVEDITTTSTDPIVISRLSDDLLHLDQSHHGRPVILTEVHSGGRGRPRIVIDPTWLRWAYGHKSIAEIARFLNVHRSTVRAALLEYGITEARSNPFSRPGDSQFNDHSHVGSTTDFDPHCVRESQAGTDMPQVTSYTRPLTDISDDDLDDAVRNLRSHYQRAGITMMLGLLRGNLGIHVSRERVRQSLLRIDPVRRVFDRIRIERRKYQVAGPNALWHHDGQHGLSVHNVRIERLWVDVTAQVTSKWATFFTDLELRHGLNINDMDHIHLLHFLFLPMINAELVGFASGWNHHTISGINRTPSDLFGWDMYVHGVRGGQLASDSERPLSEQELEDYGVDFEGLADDALLESREANNPQAEDVSSFLGRIPPPDRLNTITVETEDLDLPGEMIQGLQQLKDRVHDQADDETLIGLWTASLVLMSTYFENGSL
ncbi:uncharacterized protein C8Q71DRAFT_710059 [Rhodofomes roseus]|uniref:Integrase core domain-containing protein n=1 Tax=Rhodofomes roseus TaxID=34475 RepID=A0ABQ8KCI5_9APHY|nr:uncharacterized protein C8Q71DRAFT_710059 [Rhodofomes roseus]KAH9835205.1 hypothetical protein C8Q71DRAFT_710059 [Rhodofomes roseus]